MAKLTITLTREDVEQTLRDRDLVLNDYAAQEWVLKQTFEKYPFNTDFKVVLMKVTLLNLFYSTGIRDLKSVAQNIVDKKIDADLTEGKPEVVHRIAQVNHNGKTINHFSFATKYCSFHHSDLYPIYDDFVYRVLSKLRGEFTSDHFCPESIMDKHWKEGNKDCGFNRFRKIYDAFMKRYGEAFAGMSYKEVDNYLWGSRKIAQLEANDDHINAGNRKIYEKIIENNINKIMNK